LTNPIQVGRATLWAKCDTNPGLVEIVSSPSRGAAGLLCAAHQEKVEQPWRILAVGRTWSILRAVLSAISREFCRGVGGRSQHDAVAVCKLGRWSDKRQVSRRPRWLMAHAEPQPASPGRAMIAPDT
jgi:hypothetical protein